MNFQKALAASLVRLAIGQLAGNIITRSLLVRRHQLLLAKFRDAQATSQRSVWVARARAPSSHDARKACCGSSRLINHSMLRLRERTSQRRLREYALLHGNDG